MGRKLQSKAGFIFMLIFSALGIYWSILSAIYAGNADPGVLYIVGSTIAFALAGLFAQVWAKYQVEAQEK